MRKILLYTVLLFIFFTLSLSLSNRANSETSLRNYKPIRLAKGSFLKAISQHDISTATAKVGDIEYFLNPADVFVGESIVIPQHSLYLGEVEEIIEAVEGINASMKIKIYKVITPDRTEYSLDANLVRNGSTRIGGDLTQVAYYTRIPHYSGNWKHGVLQYVPTSIHEMGRPTFIRAGDEVTIIINTDQSLYKPIE